MSKFSKEIFSRMFGKPGSESGDLDDVTLRHLEAAGADLRKETEVLFFLYFPTEEHAQSAAKVAEREGFEAEVMSPPTGFTEWNTRLTRRMAPARAAIKAVRARLEELASSLGGDFDGWEAAVTK